MYGIEKKNINKVEIEGMFGFFFFKLFYVLENKNNKKKYKYTLVFGCFLLRHKNIKNTKFI